ncbi:hypothetical protein TURU_164646 [Turdus rufiventris]|nr:hypothetical protein TURU_164646 [Turdus rufiventris]
MPKEGWSVPSSSSSLCTYISLCPMSLIPNILHKCRASGAEFGDGSASGPLETSVPFSENKFRIKTAAHRGLKPDSPLYLMARECRVWA